MLDKTPANVSVDGDYVGATATTPDGRGAVVATTQFPEGTAASIVENDNGAVYSLRDLSADWQRITPPRTDGR